MRKKAYRILLLSSMMLFLLLAMSGCSDAIVSTTANSMSSTTTSPTTNAATNAATTTPTTTSPETTTPTTTTPTTTSPETVYLPPLAKTTVKLTYLPPLYNYQNHEADELFFYRLNSENEKIVMTVDKSSSLYPILSQSKLDAMRSIVVEYEILPNGNNKILSIELSEKPEIWKIFKINLEEGFQNALRDVKTLAPIVKEKFENFIEGLEPGINFQTE